MLEYLGDKDFHLIGNQFNEETNLDHVADDGFSLRITGFEEVACSMRVLVVASTTIRPQDCRLKLF